jgi:hypothetical protein
MTHGTEHAAAEHGGQPYFSDAEWNLLRESDVSAARAIVILMQGIFVIGLVLYLIVAVTM